MDTYELLALLRDARFSHGIRCPRCGGRDCPRWGRFSGRQRYRCRECTRTFSDLTGSPAAYSKKLAAWWVYAFAMKSSETVRKSALLTGVHPSTAFRWRHANLRARGLDVRETLQGWTEVASVWFAYSEKGRRPLDRPARRRGLREPWPDARRGVNVLLGCDRLGHVVSRLAGPANGRRLYLADLEASLTHRIASNATLTMPEGPLGPGARFAERAGCSFVDSRGALLGRASILAHLRTAADYRRRLLSWMKKFRGVATKYLANYLAWHLAVDQELRQSAEAVILRWPIENEFP